MRKYRCRKCGGTNYDWSNRKDAVRKVKTITFLCKGCGLTFSYDKPWTPKLPGEAPWCEYEMRDGVPFLKTDRHDFIPVGLRRDERGHLLVVPLEKANYFPNCN